MNISVNLILEAIEYYKTKGYTLIDVPLVVDRDISQHTKPVGVPDLNHVGDKVYVASAEQSFLQLYKEHKLPKGKLMALTPCYRHEGVLDEIHFSMFLKLELFSIKDDYRVLIEDAYRFMEKHMEVSTVYTDQGQDIIHLSSDTELGSYGFRSLPNTFNKYYSYGTGIAEPRFSLCKSGGL